MLSKKLSSTFMIVNLIAIILIILIHYNSKYAIDTSQGYNINYLIQETLANGFARSAVPIFALLSGFFLGKYTIVGYRSMVVNKFHTLFVPYILASIIIYSPYFIYMVVTHSPNLDEMNFFSYIYIILLHPTSGQFWFLRDLMILVLISPILFNIPKYISYIIIGLLFLLWMFNIQPFPIVFDWYFLNIETLFFFMLGAQVRQNSLSVESFLFCQNKYKVAIFFLWFLLIILRIFIDPDLDVWYVQKYTIISILLYKLAIIIGVISLFQISTLFRNNNFFIYLSGLTFFVFLFHNSPLHRITHLTDHIITPAYAFYFYFPLIVFLMFLLGYLMSAKMTFLYNLISGNRNPSKAVKRLSQNNKISEVLLKLEK